MVVSSEIDWKARAEKAEARVAELERNVDAAVNETAHWRRMVRNLNATEDDEPALAIEGQEREAD